ncbi:uncharacterized protein KQ657_005065 [Scheffersomyces spartinae]|uniref:Uncharacterized protein n=1 Tax=Scheffersomyces spartinae TaxID=45513 RepID=A0A9P7V9P8_9ASCO|nr:uncharacterized protein KQ657_005065 [Scheffersomyces spartinae]KAG7193867.1 hypothetical protein KQ657_005065 [Scheffersomyces spartinae]
MYLENSLSFGGKSVPSRVGDGDNDDGVRSNVATLSQSDVLANMMYFYLTFLLAVIALGGIGFCIREYTVSVALKTSPTSLIIRDSNWSGDSSTPKENGNECKLFLSGDSQQPTAPGLVQEPKGNQDDLYVVSNDYGGHDKGSINVKRYKHLNKSKCSLVDNSLVTPNYDAKLQLSTEDLINSGFCDKSIAKFMYEQSSSTICSDQRDLPLPVQEMESKKSTKLVYSLKKCNKIREKVNKAIFTEHKQIFQFFNQTRIPATAFETLWQADKMISGIRRVVLDPGNSSNEATVAKGIEVLKMISIASTTFDRMGNLNPNFFLPQYNDLIEVLIDTGAVFDVVDKVTDTAKVLFIDSTIKHLWSHLTYRESDTLMIEMAFSQFKTEPYLKPRKTIFRLFCNLRLGIHLIKAPGNILKRFETQLIIFSSELVKKIRCNEHISLIPMLAQAIDLSVDTQIKYFFYQITHKIIVLHNDCCIGESLDDDSLDIKAIIQHGMWKLQNHLIRSIAKDTFEILCLIRPGVIMWQRELLKGLVDPSSAVIVESHRSPTRINRTGETSGDTLTLNDLEHSTSSGSRFRGRTPGSWDIGI